MDLPRLAIDSALKRDWKTAIRLNLQIIAVDHEDIDALSRLGRAFMETGQKTRAAQVYQKVLKLDKFNQIAEKNLLLIKTSRLPRSSHSSKITSVSPPPQFLEEPGITKTVTLTRLGDRRVITRLRPGDPVFLAAREHCVSIVSSHQDYLGRLPDDMASRMRRFIKGGNKYYAWIKNIDLPIDGPQSVRVFIREAVRAPIFKDMPSFPLTERLTYAAFTPPELVHDEKPQTSSTEEDTGESMRSDSEIETEISEIPPSGFTRED